MFRVKQLVKMFLQNIFLPLFYAWYARKPIEKGSVIFADAHHDEIPFSMRRVYDTLVPQEAAGGGSPAGSRKLMVFVRDFAQVPYGELLRYLIRFMKQYATTEYVFVCDYYLPVASCRKRPETKVVQLWHSCGLMKKIAYDAGEDIPKGYHGNMFGNYTYLTLSAQVCVPVHARALQIPEERIYATGVSRTDYFFDEEWDRKCREVFYEQYPQARGRKIALWAPTFRGNAAMPRLEGLSEIRRVSEALSVEWYFVVKAHPHVDAHGTVSNCAIPTEELLPVADLLITDYSSVMFDYLFFQRPIILFAPDLEQYEKERGFYIDYQEIPYPITRTGKELERAVRDCGRGQIEEPLLGTAEKPGRVPGDGESPAGDLRGFQRQADFSGNAADCFREKYVGACDGHATERILELVGLGR